MSLLENVNVEFKSAYSKTVVKEIVAFLNTVGGTLYIGIADDGSVVGVDNLDDTMLKITNIIRDAVLPEPVPFTQTELIYMEEHPVIKITVNAGSEKPYFIKERGLTPEGVFVRRGTACQPLALSGIREMIAETSGRSFEECRCILQDLNFDFFKSEMKKCGIPIEDAQMKTLKLIGRDGLYTNLAYLLSDECPYTVKVAVFEGKDKTEFRARKEFSGSVLKQLSDVYDYLDMFNKTKVIIKGLYRSDIRDYPEEALREALLNSIVHRDYSFSGSTMINMFSDHIEFSSLGGLVNGLSMEAIFMGISQSRNPNLAALFYRMKLIESYGTGIEKMKRLYENSSIPPVFKSAEGAFLVVLYNKNENGEKQIKNKEQLQILDYIERNGSITRKDAETLLGVSTTKAYNALRELCDSGVIKQESQGRKSKYILV